MNKHRDTIDMATNKNDIKTAGVDRNKKKSKSKTKMQTTIIKMTIQLLLSNHYNWTMKKKLHLK